MKASEPITFLQRIVTCARCGIEGAAWEEWGEIEGEILCEECMEKIK